MQPLTIARRPSLCVYDGHARKGEHDCSFKRAQKRPTRAGARTRIPARIRSPSQLACHWFELSDRVARSDTLTPDR